MKKTPDNGGSTFKGTAVDVVLWKYLIEGETTVKEEFITELMQRVLPYLDNAQLKQLRQALEQTLHNYDFICKEGKPEEDNSLELLSRFIAAKRVEGCSEKTLKYYQATINTMVTTIGKSVCHILTEDGL